VSQVILDEQMDRQRVLYPLRAWIPATTVTDLFPNEVIKDDRIPTILRQLKQPTFVTIDAGFWRKKLCDPRYCLVYFALTEDQQNLIPVLLRRLLRHPEFKSKAVRMGKVIRMSRTRIDYWQWGDDRIHHLGWPLES
jgi:hypothetical protein